MMQRMYYRLLKDLKEGNKSSPIFAHHIDFLMSNRYTATDYMEKTEHNQIVVDYIASMTDDYCTELYKFLYPKSHLNIKYHGYFEGLDTPV